MKIFFTTLLVIFFFTNSLPQTSNDEFRSIWIVTWDYISGGSTVEQNKQRINTILDNMNKANMTSVLWQVRQAGTAYYESSYEPWGQYAGGTHPGFDPLQYAIEEAHKRGLELHAWFNVFASASTAPGSPAAEHPEWICRDPNGAPMTGSSIALSPGLPAVREYLNTVAMEIVRKYDIDGFHLDYIRWNEYNSAAGRYLYDVEHPYSGGVPSGFDNWDDWRRWSVTEFVKSLQDSIKSEKPYVKLSVAALGNYNWGGWNGYYTVFQDAALWFNEGYIDQIAGMHYHWTDAAGFLGMLVNYYESWARYIQPGIAAGRLYTVGPPSYILHEQNKWGNHPSIVSALRTVDWVDGFQFFSYSSWRERSYFSEAGETYLARKTKVRNMFQSDEVVPVPSVAISKTDDLNYSLRITPPAVDQAYWFAVYRSETDNFNTETSRIVHIAFSDSAFTFNDSFNGLQDHNGSYYYKVTMLNRYWKESDLSNTAVTDPIPSNAPVIVFTSPAEGDTTSVNIPVEIRFSKSVNQVNIQNHFSFDPPVDITSIITEPKRLVINTNGFEFKTNYRLTIDGQLEDVNGRKLDGNNDGVEGDPFYLNFVTVDVDTAGPYMVYVYPETTDSMDVEDVIRITFNEPLDSPLVASNIKLYRNGVGVTSEAVLHNYGSGAVISVKPPLLAQSEDYLLTIGTQLADKSGNKLAEEINIPFRTKALGYDFRLTIDNFITEDNWKDPGYSGSTVGILIPGTEFALQSLYYLPSTSPKKGAKLGYKWDPDAANHLLREYLAQGTPRSVEFDGTHTLQVYIHGDGSGTLFRFAIDEDNGTNTWPFHEVSKWMPINWRGWKLVEWDLTDPSLVGSWIGNEILDGTKYRVDSFQLTVAEGSASQGIIYLDNLRAVKKSFAITSVEENIASVADFRLYQNYPNPFNPSTTIVFDLDRGGKVSLEIFDILGRKIKTLLSEEMSAGRHNVLFDASDLSSGQYIYRIISGEKQISKMMILLK